MNAAARLLTHSHISRTWVVSVIVDNLEFSRILLIVALLMSALSMIYVTNVNRDLNADIQQTLIERNQLHVEWGQLLLQKTTWTRQLRIEQVAEEKLNMIAPDNIITIKE